LAIISPGRILAEATTPPAGLMVTYSGSLRPTDSAGDGRPIRAFKIQFLVTEATPGGGCKVAWVLDEESGSPRSSWAQRFGAVLFTASNQPLNDRELPAIQAERDGMVRVLLLRLPLWPDFDRLAANSKWEVGELRFDVMSRDQAAGRQSWKVGIANRLGPREVVWIDEKEAIVTRHRELVFLGQGVAHELALELDKHENVPADQLVHYQKAYLTLTALRGPVKDKLMDLPESSIPASTEVLEQARSAAGEIQATLKSGIYVDLAQATVREVASSLSRQSNLEKLVKRFVGSPAPNFALKTTRGDQISLSDFEGKPVVLHFWDYQSEPKVAPYGETGYLDFVWRQRQNHGIVVLGIAVDSRLRSEATRSAGRKDVRAFCDFMNLSYPVAFDDGNERVIDLFGDPRTVGAKLPLYVVIAPDGRVVEYHAGLWSKSADEGLKELEQQLQKLK
jgi:peroxiredoxin